MRFSVRLRRRVKKGVISLRHGLSTMLYCMRSKSSKNKAMTSRISMFQRQASSHWLLCKKQSGKIRHSSQSCSATMKSERFSRLRHLVNFYGNAVFCSIRTRCKCSENKQSMSKRYRSISYPRLVIKSMVQKESDCCMYGLV